MIALVDVLKGGDGLYPGRVNEMPQDYLDWGRELAETIVKVDPDGNPQPIGGKKVLGLLNGMSNWNQEGSAFIGEANAKYGKEKAIIFGGSRGGWPLDRVVSDPIGFWESPRGGIMTKLAKAKISPMQVQAAAMKNSIRGLNAPLDSSADQIQALWNLAIKTTLKYLPNVKLFYVSSAIYSGYGLKPLPRKEPQAFYEGYGVKQLVEQHIDSHRAGKNTPFVAWGPYIWANGTETNSEGLEWLVGDFELKDGIHPGPTAEAKVAGRLLSFFESHPTTAPWFVGAG